MTLAVPAALAIVAGCGGGSGRGESSGSTVSERYYALAPSGHFLTILPGVPDFLSLIDPLRPDREIPVDTSHSAVSRIAELEAGVYDPASQTFTEFRRTGVVYQKSGDDGGGRLYRLSLAIDAASPRPEQISSAADICDVGLVVPDWADPRRTWLQVWRTAPDGRCFSTAQQPAWISVGDDATTAPRTAPMRSGRPIGFWIDRETGRPGGVLHLDGDRLVAASPVDPAAPQSVATLATGIVSASKVADGARGVVVAARGAGGAFLQWIDPAAQPPILGRRAALVGSGEFIGYSYRIGKDRNAFYVHTAAGPEFAIWRLPTNAVDSPTRLLSGAGQIGSTAMDDTHVYAAVRREDAARPGYVVQVPKAGGASRRLLDAGDRHPWVIDLLGNSVYIGSGSVSGGQSEMRMLRDGAVSGDPVRLGDYVLGFPRAPTVDLNDDREVIGILYAQSDAGSDGHAVAPGLPARLVFRDDFAQRDIVLGTLGLQRLAQTPQSQWPVQALTHTYANDRASFQTLSFMGLAFNGSEVERDHAVFSFDLTRAGSLVSAAR